MAQDKKQELLEELNKKFNEGMEYKKNAEIIALININYINGKQNIRYNPRLNVIEEMQIEGEAEYREREVFNRIRSFRNSVISKVKEKIPVAQVVPLSQDDEDVDVAKATNAVLNDVANKQHLPKLLKKAFVDLIDIGPAFIHVKWNPDGGEVLLSDIESLLGDQSGLLSPEQKQAIAEKLSSRKEVMSGDVEYEFVKFFEIIVANPYEQDLKEQEWIMRVKAYKKEEAEKIFKTTFTETETIAKITMAASRAETRETLARNLGIQGKENESDMVVIREYFEKPCYGNEEGRYIVWGGGKILKDEALPYINDEYGKRTYPFVKFDLDTPASFYSHAFIEDLKPIQKRYNNIRNRKYEYVVKNVHGQIAVQEGSLSDDTKITNKPGSILKYKRGFAVPEVIRSSATNTLDTDSELNSLEGEFSSITGISSLTLMGTPDSSGIRGANMTQMLMEADDSKFSLIIDTMSEAVVEISKHTIRLYKQFMLPNEVRFTRFTKDLSTSVNWKADLLTEDIEIKNIAQLSKSDARRKQDLQALINSPLFSKEFPFGAEMQMRLMEEFDAGISINELPVPGSADIKKARRENRLIVTQMAQIDADDIDDHNVHYDIHASYMKSEEYRKLVIANPQMDQLMRAHMQQHQQIVQAQQTRIQAEAIAQQSKK